MAFVQCMLEDEGSYKFEVYVEYPNMVSFNQFIILLFPKRDEKKNRVVDSWQIVLKNLVGTDMSAHCDLSHIIFPNQRKINYIRGH